MVDEASSFLADPTGVEAYLNSFAMRRDHFGPDRASGTFTTTFDERMHGAVVTKEKVVGVWSDRDGDRVTRATFFRVESGTVLSAEFIDINWGYFDLVQAALEWSRT